MNDSSRMLKALANPRRVALLKHLRKTSEENVGNLACVIKLSIKSTSHHLVILSAAKLVEKEQRSTSVFYRLARPLKPFVHEILSEP